MLEMESLVTEEVSTEDDREGVSSPELVEECVPDLDRDAGTGREKTGAMTKSISRLPRDKLEFTHRTCPRHQRRDNAPLSCCVRVNPVVQTSYVLRLDRWVILRSFEPR